MDYVLRFRDQSYPIENAYHNFEKSHICLKIFQGQKMFLKACFDNHIMRLSIDVKLKNSIEFFTPARKLILEGRIKSRKN